jgi:hypothetical protein
VHEGKGSFQDSKTITIVFLSALLNQSKLHSHAENGRKRCMRVNEVGMFLSAIKP